MSIEPEQVNDTVMRTEVTGGFVFVTLYDADDHFQYQLGEDEIVHLLKYLTKVKEEYKL